KTQRDKKAEASFNPPRLLTGSSTGILKYVEDLRRGSNAEVGPKDYFEIASNSPGRFFHYEPLSTSSFRKNLIIPEAVKFSKDQRVTKKEKKISEKNKEN
ncbi:MAG: hypothetical protein C0611_07805, partial [Desulfobacteraceae bacterium]